MFKYVIYTAQTEAINREQKVIVGATVVSAPIDCFAQIGDF